MSLYNGERDAALAKPANPIDRWNDDDAAQAHTTALNFAPPRVLPSPGFPSLGLPNAGSPLPPAPPVSTRPTPTLPTPTLIPARNADLAAAGLSSTNSKMTLTPTSTPAFDASASSPSLRPVIFILAGYLALSGLYDAVGVVSPGRISSTAWRFGVVGAVAPTLVKPVLGLCLASFALLSMNRKLLSIAMIVLQVASAALIAVIIPMFLLDALQVRPVLPENMTGRPFVMNVSIAVAFLVAAIVVQLACARTLFTAMRAAQAEPTSALRRGWSE